MKYIKRFLKITNKNQINNYYHELSYQQIDV